MPGRQHQLLGPRSSIIPLSGARTDGVDPERAPKHEQAPESDLRSSSFQQTPQPASDDYYYSELVRDGVPPLIAEAQVRHRRDLPELLKEHAGTRVAYRGSERLAIGSSERELTLMCMQRGLKDDEFLVRAVVPESEAVIDETMWITF